MPLTRIDHVQLAIPRGGEDAARGCYGTLLGLDEVAKPPKLAARGGCWFERGALRIHLGSKRISVSSAKPIRPCE